MHNALEHATSSSIPPSLSSCACIDSVWRSSSTQKHGNGTWSHETQVQARDLHLPASRTCDVSGIGGISGQLSLDLLGAPFSAQGLSGVHRAQEHPKRYDCAPIKHMTSGKGLIKITQQTAERVQPDTPSLCSLHFQNTLVPLTLFPGATNQMSSLKEAQQESEKLKTISQHCLPVSWISPVVPAERSHTPRRL